MEESFYYLSVLLAVVLGLAITHVLLGLRGLILTRAKVKLYFPSSWAVGGHAEKFTDQSGMSIPRRTSIVRLQLFG